ncbi:MAG TPA: hypothetical protein VFD36_20555 [Kofleriaceae bacterium]|nr:hypothetical protein [Kofleriaceae bacterium]
MRTTPDKPRIKAVRHIASSKPWIVLIDGRQLCSTPQTSRPQHRKQGYGRVRNFKTEEAAIAAAEAALADGTAILGWQQEPA